MEWSKTVLVFVFISTILIPGIINNPLLTDIFGTTAVQPYMIPANMNGLQLGVEVEISIRAEHLRDTDLFTKSDPICYTSTRTGFSLAWNRIHQTEMVENDLSPIFMRKPVMSTMGAENVSIKFEFYDRDAMRDDILGFSVGNLGQLIAAGTTSLSMQKRVLGVFQNSVRGRTVITTERLINNNDQVTFNLSAFEIVKKDAFSLSDPYIEILKKSPGDNFVLVHRTEYHKNRRSVNWAQFSVLMKNLCNGDFHRPLLFICWDWNFNAKSTLIGQFQTTMHELHFMRKNNFELLSSVQVAGHLNVSMQYNGTYQPGMTTGAAPGAMPGGMYVPPAYPGAQSFPVGQMGQMSAYGQTPNASMMYGQTANSSMMHGQPQVPMAPFGVNASVPVMQPSVPLVGATMSTIYPSVYPPTAGAFGTTVPVANSSATPYGVQPNVNQPVYPGGMILPTNQSMFHGPGSHYYTKRR